ncbi:MULTISPECIES: histidine phosphatase family protein [unclassified Mesorhizobium]|uniref:histidine phosphatase family protein n=1 Tax=unclassified Mesorhizobium TaxID=325217 RepID=UPI000FDAAA79|nr:MULTISPECIES: histidine phosphatase family protein [unclassified Mesorhizobium]TGR37831.1 histidine phosphatase family protein [bacterium M00.F.Ca.ET.199.01.1.1]TGU23471.1 histidine phosphatase family protein [bacterium M00.F.Ca.ET.156.01.1.1]TGV90822.1 histidine phosphatase family protein [Mesorhizobium sp. M00.F.Ca.ET.149.01.1.1]TGR18144.1 histidine phosphatase family protein [Mesorhizobium sp. M8A.F.Ca.ET.202.01.1.1]TGR20243.1 histidine phosphatase family protein [Mesorhizobium sp. M8A.F
MSIAYYITHPQVQIDATIPVPDWGLSDIGRARAHAMLDQPWIASIARVVSSGERKAVETAEVLGRHLDLAVQVRERMHENDRSATGFLPPPEFEAVADRFFANPHESIRGWERAIDAQQRIVSEVEAVLDAGGAGDIALVGHGGVGTLLLVSLSGSRISRDADQPAGGGNYFAYDIGARRLIHGWRPIDRVEQPLNP